MSEPKSTDALPIPNGEVNRGDIPVELIQTSLRTRLCRMPHGRHIKDKRNKLRPDNFIFDNDSNQNGDAAFTLATPQDLQYS
jgi:hypothetical protein